METSCKQCKNSFQVTTEEDAFRDKVSPIIADKKYLIPAPTLCPPCRAQRRLAHRNERNLFHRSCSFSNKTIIAAYPPSTPFPVYDNEVWWSDRWDPKSYGREFDFNRGFFEQIKELQNVVPRMARLQIHNENSDYTHCVSNLKNCYLLFSADYDQDCAYGVWIERSRSSFDNLLIDECELCYECIFSSKLYNCRYVYFSSNCHDSAFLADCRNCSNCFMSSGLRNKEYCISNVQYTKEEYEAKMKEYPLDQYSFVESCKKQFSEFLKGATYPHLWKQGTVEESTGNFLTETYNCKDCYEVLRARDCMHIIGAFDLKDAYDCCYVNGELGYENCDCVVMPYHSSFNVSTYIGSNLLYCDNCMNNCRDCFGCVGLKGAQYCIFNKQYTKEEYEILVPKIIEHIKKTGDFGEFFPVGMSPFGYNLTEAFDCYPLTKKQVHANGWLWHEEDPNENMYVGTPPVLPDSIKEADESYTNKVLVSVESGKPYKVTAQELRYYKAAGIPLPRKTPTERYLDRLHLRNGRSLYTRTCDECSSEMTTTYAPARPEKVVCETCYLKSIH